MDRVKRAAEVCCSNLNRLTPLKDSVKSRRSAHIRELGLVLAEAMPQNADVFEEGRHIYEDSASELLLSDTDAVTLCCAIAEGLSNIRELIPLIPAKKRCTVSYVKNPLSDLAFDSFSLFFDRVSVSYADDFVSALEDVYHSKSDYAVLPVYSEKGGRLKNFCDLAEKYEMKKILNCRVYSNTEDTETEFALFSKNCEQISANRRTEMFFEFSLPEADIPKALAYITLRRCRIGWMNMGEERAELCLELPQAEILSLCVYLMLHIPAHEIKGVY